MDYRDYKAVQSNELFWFRAKNKLIEHLLALTTPQNQNIKILNLGAGTGSDLKILSQFGNVYVIDVNEKALELVPSEFCIEKRLADACKLPYEDLFFDIVVAFDVLEHIENDVKAVSEVRRVLKNEGLFLITVPAFPVLFSAHDKILAHYRRYNKKSLTALFAGYSNLYLNFWNSFLFPFAATSRFFKRNDSPKIDKHEFPKIVDSFFYSILAAEAFLVGKKFPLPFGLSIAGVIKK